MRYRWIIMVVAAGTWLASGAIAQEATEETAAAQDTSKPLTVSLQVFQNGRETTDLEKGAPAEVIATVRLDMPDEEVANVQLALDIADELNIESEEDVKIRSLYIDNGTGYALQPTTSIRPRLRFSAPEGEVGISGVQKVKWVMTFRNNAARAPFSVTAAAMIPPSTEIVAQDRAQLTLKVRTVLSVQQLWHDGGIFMWPLGFALILGIAFALERLWTLTWAKIDAQEFFNKVAAALKNGGPDEAIEVCNKTRGPVAAVLREGLLRVDQGIDHVEKAISSAGAVEGSFLQRGMVVLASVTTIAPLLGFLGTVWGMIIAFKAIAEAGDVKPSVVADGISQALITTASGLVIAIIVQTFHNFLISRINRIIIDMEETSTMLVDLLIEQGLDKPQAASA